MDQLEAKTVRLYVIEEQEIYREIYKVTLSDKAPLEVLQVAGSRGISNLAHTVASLSADVLVLSIRKLDAAMIKEMEQIRSGYPGVGVVILLMTYNHQDIELMRRLAMTGEGGMALFLKQSLDQVEQLYRTILAVNQGQVILDPPLASFMFAGKPECPFLSQLTAREMEILGLLARGYTNSAIAASLYIDIKTVEHHLNSLYSKLKADPDYNDKHLRVSAARLYFETIRDSLNEPQLVPAAAGQSA